MNRTLRLCKRRGVSETIGTMLIIAVTVAGAVFISNVMQNIAFPLSPGTDSSSVRPESVQLTGYDTRDSVNLSDISRVDNVFDQLLCTASCNDPIDRNKSPEFGGTDFLVLHIRNTGINSVFLHNVLINNQGHTWDATTGNKVLNTQIGNNPPSSGEFPLAGKFSILPISNGTGPTITQLATNEMVGDKEVRVLIKLSADIPQDIGMWDSMRILVNYGGTQPAEFIVLSGDAKW